MRAFTSIILSLCAAYAVAQNGTSPNAFDVPGGQSTYQVTAGNTVELTWTNPQGSTVTIKLQQNTNQITPDSGIVLAQSISNTGSTTVTIPSSADIPNTGTYAFEIIEDSDPSQYNFSPPFGITSASGPATGVLGSTAAGTSTASGSTVSSAAATTTSTSGSSSTLTTSASSAAATSSSSAAASTTLSSATAAITTTAPSGNAGWKVQAPLAAIVAVGAAIAL